MENIMESITIELSIEEIAKLALMAHEKDIKFNDLIVDILQNYAKDIIENPNDPQLLIED